MAENYTIEVFDSADAAITGKTKADFALTYLVDQVSTATTAIIVTEIGSGMYDFEVPDAGVGEVHELIIKDAGTLGVAAGWGKRIDWPAYVDTATIATAVWAATTRTLSSFGTLTTDTATAVWAAGTRTLTSFGALAADVWAYATRTITGASTVTYLGPVSTTGDVEIVRGDTYAAADSRSLEWEVDGYPDFTSGSVLLTVRDDADAVVLSKAGSVVTGGAGITQKVRAELTSTDTAVDANEYDFDVQVTLASGSVVTIERGDFTVLEHYTR